MNPVQRAIVDDIVRQTGRHDEPHIFGGEPGDPGLTGPGSMSWEINGDIASVAARRHRRDRHGDPAPVGHGRRAGPVELPEDPGGAPHDVRLRRHDDVRQHQAAKRLIGAVKKMHGQVNGVRPDGVPYRALDPELIGWVHTCIPWAVMTAFDRFNRPLTDAERDRYLQRAGGHRPPRRRRRDPGDRPPTCGTTSRRCARSSRSTQQTLEFFEFLMTMPFGMRVPGPAVAPGPPFQLEAGMGLMPQWARRMAGFDAPDARAPALHDPMLLHLRAARPLGVRHAALQASSRWSARQERRRRSSWPREPCAGDPAGRARARRSGAGVRGDEARRPDVPATTSTCTPRRGTTGGAPPTSSPRRATATRSGSTGSRSTARRVRPPGLPPPGAVRRTVDHHARTAGRVGPPRRGARRFVRTSALRPERQRAAEASDVDPRRRASVINSWERTSRSARPTASGSTTTTPRSTRGKRIRLKSTSSPT